MLVVVYLNPDVKANGIPSNGYYDVTKWQKRYIEIAVGMDVIDVLSIVCSDIEHSRKPTMGDIIEFGEEYYMISPFGFVSVNVIADFGENLIYLT